MTLSVLRTTLWIEGYYCCLPRADLGLPKLAILLGGRLITQVSLIIPEVSLNEIKWDLGELSG